MMVVGVRLWMRLSGIRVAFLIGVRLMVASPHSLAPQASSLLLDVTPIRHFVDVVRSLTMPWKSQRLPQQLSSSVSVSFSGLEH